MPLYEYQCPSCNLKFELLRPLSWSDETAPCPGCHHEAQRIPSTFACFSTDESGLTTSVGGSSCASCGATSCDSCGI